MAVAFASGVVLAGAALELNHDESTLVDPSTSLGPRRGHCTSISPVAFQMDADAIFLREPRKRRKAEADKDADRSEGMDPAQRMKEVAIYALVFRS